MSGRWNNDVGGFLRFVTLVVLVIIPMPLHSQAIRLVKFSILPLDCGKDIVKPSGWVISDGEQWKKFLEKMLGYSGTPPKIDFETNTVVAISAGRRPTGGYSLQVTKVTEDSRPGEPSRAAVHYRVLSPPPDTVVTQALTYPCIVIRVEKKFARLNFDPPIPDTPDP